MYLGFFFLTTYSCICIDNFLITYLSFMSTSSEIECIAGFYGDECSSDCGHCLNNTACHHVTGTCVNGCEPGYKAPNCSIGIMQLKIQRIYCFSYNKSITNEVTK